MGEDLQATRESVVSATSRIGDIEDTMLTIEKETATRDAKSDRRKKILAVVGALLVVALIGLSLEVRKNRIATDRNSAAIERTNEIRQELAREGCERYNNSVDVDRFQTNDMYDLVLLSPQNQTEERQQLITALRAESLRRLQELIPLRDCDKAAAEAVGN